MANLLALIGVDVNLNLPDPDGVMVLQFHGIAVPFDFRRLFAKAVGPRLGTIAFTPTRTVEGEALAMNGDMTPWTEEEAGDELRRAADAYNGRIVMNGLQGSPEMPPHL